MNTLQRLAPGNQKLYAYALNGFLTRTQKRFYHDNLGFYPWVINQRGGPAPAPLSIPQALGHDYPHVVDREKQKLARSRTDYILADKEHENAFHHKLEIVGKINQIRKPRPGLPNVIVFGEGGYLGKSNIVPSFQSMIDNMNFVRENKDSLSLQNTLVVFGSNHFVHDNRIFNASLFLDHRSKVGIAIKRFHDPVDNPPNGIPLSDGIGGPTIHGEFSLVICADYSLYDGQGIPLLSAFGAPEQADKHEGTIVIADGAYLDRSGVYRGKQTIKSRHPWDLRRFIYGVNYREFVREKIEAERRFEIESLGYKSWVSGYPFTSIPPTILALPDKQ